MLKCYNLLRQGNVYRLQELRGALLFKRGYTREEKKVRGNLERNNVDLYREQSRRRGEECRNNFKEVYR